MTSERTLDFTLQLLPGLWVRTVTYTHSSHFLSQLRQHERMQLSIILIM